jgi:hypothetical protein
MNYQIFPIKLPNIPDKNWKDFTWQVCLGEASARLYVALTTKIGVALTTKIGHSLRQATAKIPSPRPRDFPTMDHNIVIPDPSDKVIAELLKKEQT